MSQATSLSPQRKRRSKVFLSKIDLPVAPKIKFILINKQGCMTSDVYETGISDHHKRISLVLRKAFANRETENRE